MPRAPDAGTRTRSRTNFADKQLDREPATTFKARTGRPGEALPRLWRVPEFDFIDRARMDVLAEPSADVLSPIAHGTLLFLVDDVGG